MMVLGYLIMCLVFGTTFLAIKVGLNAGFPPFEFAALRFFIAGALILLVLAVKKHPFPKRLADYGEMAFLGFLMTTVPFAALFWAEQYITSGTAALLVATAPVCIGVLSRLNRSQWLGTLLAVGGVYLIVSPDIGGSSSSWETWGAKLAIVCSEFAFAYGAVRSKKIVAGLSPHLFNGWQMLFASLGLFLVSFFADSGRSATWNSSNVLALLYLAIVASIFASGIYYWMLKVTNPLFPTTWTYVAPIIAMIAGALALGERLTWEGVCGAVLVIGGVLIVNRQVFLSLWSVWRKKRAARDIGTTLNS
jgi:drug/metabolite transporter (DMT)-like permease